jgi:hypothetical protein
MTEILVEHPPTYWPERKYIYDVMFGEFLGIGYQEKSREDPGTTVISVRGDSTSRHLIVHEELFTTTPDKWLTAESLPQQPLNKWVLPDVFCDTPKVSSEMPVIYGKRITEDSYYKECDGEMELGIDIFGSAFFMLTRYEEVVKSDSDEHHRFPAGASLACQERFLERPIVNEYLEVLWTCMKRLWPGLERKQRQYRVLLSHDVDHPLAVAGQSLSVLFRGCGGDVIIRKDLDLALRRIHGYYRSLQGDFSADPFNTFSFIMHLSEKIGVRSAFYIMTAEARNDFDRAYSTGHPWIRELIRSIAERGHEIGFHGSYYSYLDDERIKREVSILGRILAEEGVADSALGGRQHYLRWQAPITWAIWDDVGLSYDSTLTFPDHVGFRCGSCYEYSTYEVMARRKMQLVERPLVMMDATLLNGESGDMVQNQAYAKALDLSQTCRRFGGDFSVLWHNSSLGSEWQQRLYESIISSI